MKPAAIFALALALPLCVGAQEPATPNPTETADMETTGKTPATVYFTHDILHITEITAW